MKFAYAILFCLASMSFGEKIDSKFPHTNIELPGPIREIYANTKNEQFIIRYENKPGFELLSASQRSPQYSTTSIALIDPYRGYSDIAMTVIDGNHIAIKNAQRISIINTDTWEPTWEKTLPPNYSTAVDGIYSTPNYIIVPNSMIAFNESLSNFKPEDRIIRLSAINGDMTHLSFPTSKSDYTPISHSIIIANDGIIYSDSSNTRKSCNFSLQFQTHPLAQYLDSVQKIIAISSRIYTSPKFSFAYSFDNQRVLSWNSGRIQTFSLESNQFIPNGAKIKFFNFAPNGTQFVCGFWHKKQSKIIVGKFQNNNKSYNVKWVEIASTNRNIDRSYAIWDVTSTKILYLLNGELTLWKYNDLSSSIEQ